MDYDFDNNDLILYATEHPIRGAIFFRLLNHIARWAIKREEQKKGDEMDLYTNMGQHWDPPKEDEREKEWERASAFDLLKTDKQMKEEEKPRDYRALVGPLYPISREVSDTLIMSMLDEIDRLRAEIIELNGRGIKQAQELLETEKENETLKARVKELEKELKEEIDSHYEGCWR